MCPYLCALWLSENLIKYIFFTSVKENKFQYFSTRVFSLLEMTTEKGRIRLVF